MKNFKHFFFLSLMLLCMQAQAAERVAPTFPESATIESGKTYYLYNVDCDKWLVRSTSNTSSPGVGEYAKAVAIDVVAACETDYTLQFSDNKYYIYTNSSSMSSSSSTGYSGHYVIAGSAAGYTIQRSPENTDYYVESEFVGYPTDATTDRITPNVAEGSITWKFIEKDAAEYYIAKKRLYDALVVTDTYFYTVDNFEKVYADPNSSTELLSEAADNIEGGLLLSSQYTSREWSDYPIFFENDAAQNWKVYKGYDADYDHYFHVTAWEPGTFSLKARVTVDADATLSYFIHEEYERDFAAEVYIDGVKVREIAKDLTDENCGYGYSRYFERMSAGKHEIEWRCIRTTPESTAGHKMTIRGIGIEKTPYFEVSLLEPGSLGTEVLYNVDHVQDVRRIKIKGTMNDDDWAKVAMMTNLYSIDLSEANITSIPDGQFNNSTSTANCRFLHEVILPEGLTTIGENSFRGLNIQKITLPSTLESIGNYAFQNSMLTEITIPDNVTSIGLYAFYQCFLLENVTYSKGMTYVPGRCFYDCNNLNTMKLHDGLTTINHYAFSETYKFNPRFPKSLNYIGEYAFKGCAMDSLFLNEDITLSGGYHFNGCDSLVYAEFPTSYYSVNGYGIVNYCENLKTLVLKSPTVLCNGSTSSKYDYKGSFLNGCPSDVVIKVPSFLVNSYKLDEYWYNYTIEGFNTGDVKQWTLNNDLVMNARERFDGEPNLKINQKGSIKLNGDVAQVFGSLQTASYNYYSGTNSDAFARILVNNDQTSIKGEYKHKYYVEGKYWFFVCLPFDFKISDVTPSVEGTKFVFRYYDGAARATSGASGNWKNYDSDAVITAGTGFIVQASASCWLTFTAIDNDSKQNVVSNEEFVKALAENASETASNSGWNLVGNPWQCWYNIHALNFIAPITTYDVSSKKYNAYSIIDDDYAIAPNEAFFVQCPENITSISFPETGRQLTSEIVSQQSVSQQYPSAAVKNPRRIVDIVLACGELSDRTRVVFNEEALAEYEKQCDASKFFSSDAVTPQIYTIGDDATEYAINERPYGDGQVQLGVVLAADGEYTFSLERNNTAGVTIVDNEAGVTHKFADGDYTFSAEAGNYPDRFVILVAESKETTAVENVAAADYSVAAVAGGISISGAEGAVTVYAMNGSEVARVTGDAVVPVASGTYIVRSCAGAVKVVVK